MKRWQKITLNLILTIFLLAFGALLNISYKQGQDIVHNAPPDRSIPEETPADYGLEYENVSLVAADGVHLAAWYVPSQNGAVIIVQHGYKSHRGHVLTEAEIFTRHGYGVFMLDLRGHGNSEGDLITFGLLEMQDMEAGYQYLLTRPEVDPERIGIVGNSMGGSVVINYAAQNPQIKAVVAHSAFSSLQDTVVTGVQTFANLPPFPFAPLIQFFAEQEASIKASEIAAKEVIGSISPRPIFILHAGGDTVVGPDAGQVLFDAAGEPKEFWYHPAYGHVPFVNEEPEEYERRVVAFFDQYLLLNP
jgi:alpha-beta hydrolase superfamily lysophospholipase